MKTGRLVVLQNSLPSYRVDFFEKVSALSDGQIVVLYSSTDLGVLTSSSVDNNWAKCLGKMSKIGMGLEWQSGVFSFHVEADDIVIISAAPRCISNFLFLILLRLRGIKTILWGHYWSSTSRPYRFLIRMLLLRLSHALLFYTDQEVAEYKGGVGLNDKRLIMALNNGINLDPILPVREIYAAASRGKRLLFIGRLTVKAEVGILLRALTDPRLSALSLDVIGDGEESDRLRTLTKVLGLSERVFWHGATVDEAVVASTVNNCLIFVYPGSVGLSLIHAMAYGLPSIIHDDRWHQGPEVAAFEKGITGLTFKRGSCQSLSDALVVGISDYKWLDDAAVASKNKIKEKYNTSAMAGKLINLRDELFFANSKS